MPLEKRFVLPAQTAVIHSASPTQWLSDQLATAVSKLGYDPSDGPLQNLMQLPALVPDAAHLGRFATPLPLKLASQRSQVHPIASAETVGHALLERLNGLPQPSWIAPQYWMHPNGWLYAEFLPESLAQWLQTGLTLKPYLEVQTLVQSTLNAPIALSKGISADPGLFELQYAHARCCSLLRLGHQAQLIQLADTDSFNLILPNPVPWLALLSDSPLRTQSEHQLLLALLNFPQSLGSSAIYGRLQGTEPADQSGHQTLVQWPLSDRTLQRHPIWSQIFQQFYSDCRVLAAIHPKTLELAQAQLASLAILKNRLEFWLITLLRVDAPTEL
jgi:hypothetical protein